MSVSAPYPATMRALIQRHDGFANTSTGPAIDRLSDWVDLAEIAVPEPAEGQVLVKMLMASVNPADLHFIKGEYGQPRRKGFPAGSEGVGEVVAGKGARAEAMIGQRVTFTVTPDGSGAWADYALTSAGACIPLRPDLRNEDAASLVVNPLSAMAMFDLARKAGAKAIVLTAGGSQLCKLMIGLARDEGVAAIAVIRRASEAAHLKALGAREVLVEGEPDFAARFADACKTHNPTKLFDAVAGQVSADLFFAMPKGTRWVVYGKLDSGSVDLSQMGQLIFSSKTITGFWLVEWFRNTAPAEQARVIGEVQARFVAGAWKTEIAARVSLGDALDKLAPALALRAGKVLITP